MLPWDAFALPRPDACGVGAGAAGIDGVAGAAAGAAALAAEFAVVVVGVLEAASAIVSRAVD